MKNPYKSTSRKLLPIILSLLLLSSPTRCCLAFNSCHLSVTRKMRSPRLISLFSRWNRIPEKKLTTELRMNSQSRVITRSLLSSVKTITQDTTTTYNLPDPNGIVIIPESEWRERAAKHLQKITTLLSPGMIPPSGKNPSPLRGLDPHHPTYNFLIEYYGIKGTKGCRRLARWSPGLQKTGILLQNANENDFSSTLHLRGATLLSPTTTTHHDLPPGALYHPPTYTQNNTPLERQIARASSYTWFRTVLSNTFDRPPILHCFGMHEWAMLYHPPGAPPPPSAKFQSHLPLRVSRETINAAVERKGVSCTHFDAIRFFADASLPLLRREGDGDDDMSLSSSSSSCGTCHRQSMTRNDQLTMEQPGCVHAQMDLLKMALKLVPYVSSRVLRLSLEVALEARKLDVAASPYDAVAGGYGDGLEAVKVETVEGRRVYKERQREIMERGQVVRRMLLEEYDHFLGVAFSDEVLERVTLGS